MPTTTRTVLRQSICKKLYAGHFPIIGTTTSDSDSYTLLIDSSLAPAAHSEDYYRTWVYVSTQPTKAAAGSNTNNGGDLTAAATSLIVADGTKFTIGDGIMLGADVEIMLVSNVAGNTLTITRGIQGTTAAIHDLTPEVAVYIIGPAVGEVARVTNVDFSGSNSKLTVAPHLSCSPVSGAQYELHYHFYPTYIHDKLNEILENVRHPIWLPLTLITDGDMETAGVANWTAAGTGGVPTLAKNTSTVLFGRQALSITNDGATTHGYAKSATVYLPPDTEVFIAGLVYITSGDSAKLTLYDVTNSAAIETAESNATGWVLLMFTDVLPATCEAVSLWLESPAVSDVTYWNFAALLSTMRSIFDYPSTLEWSEDFDGVWWLPEGTSIDGSNNDLAYRVLEQPIQKWSEAPIFRDETAVRPYRLQVLKRPINRPLFIKGLIDYSTMSADTDTTTMPPDIAVDLTYADMMDTWAQEELAHDHIEAAAAKAAKAEQVRKMLAPRWMQFSMPRGRIQGTFR